MKLNMFSVYDSKAMAFLPPFFLPTQGQAERAFRDCANDPTHAFGRHGEDYTLFHLGMFDDVLADVDIFTPVRSLGLASSFKSVLNSEVSNEDAI